MVMSKDIEDIYSGNGHELIAPAYEHMKGYGKPTIAKSKPTPIKASKAFDYMPRDELIIIAEALDSLFMGDEDLEKQRAKMLKQAKHILRVRHGLKETPPE